MQADEVPVDVEFVISSYFSGRNFETGSANADVASLQASCHRRSISAEGFGRKDEYLEALWWSCMLEQQLSDSESTQQLQRLQEGYDELLQNQVDQQKLLRRQHERQKYLQQQLESHQQCLLTLYQHASQRGSHSQQGGVSHQGNSTRRRCSHRCKTNPT
ncbi:hypothetical protein PHYPSEUDO_010996 [Phytophthora pseudosyringae]|uniref:Uncharacterized protein n=1 Tax=Phytophthora pseudosyringae TaxID=221518 RepID=A0A8T1WAV9_9STRA|nr:hypothetical protein PHYPSEUDO_010996 [Phytophthora pseudosyringae]